MRQKVYCGTKAVLPEGYDRFAIPYQCLKKGYGSCLYANKRGTGRNPSFFQLPVLMLLLTVVLFFVGLLFMWDRYFTGGLFDTGIPNGQEDR